VNDPGYSTTSYALNTIVDGQNGIYRVGNGDESVLAELEAIQQEIENLRYDADESVEIQ
jgi:hypothetical protein